MKMKNIISYLLIPFFAFFSASSFAQFQITGPSEVCSGACFDYVANATTLSWSYDVSGPTGDTGVSFTDNGSVGTLCLTSDVFPQTVIILTVINWTTGDTYTLDIFVGFTVDVEIFAPDCYDGTITTLSTNIVDPTGGQFWDYVWTTTDGNFISGTNSSTPVISGSGTYCLQVFNQFDCSGQNCVSIAPTDLEILPNSIIFCEQDSLSPNPCQKVCSNSQMTYEAIGATPGSDVQWQVFGAQDYEVNGNQVTVEWGEPGQGEITAEVSDSNGADPFNAYCGQIQGASQGSTDGIGYIYIDGGQGPYDIQLTGPGGFVAVVTASQGLIDFHNLISGTYIIEVVLNGNLVFNCNFLISDEGLPDQCNVSGFFEEIEHASDCNSCDGWVSLAETSGFQPFQYIWSNGSTTPSQQGLCPGNYSLTIVDEFGCTEVLDLTIGCPQGCSASTSYCVDIIEDPRAEMITTPSATNNQIEICEGQTVFFQNQSMNATSFIWDFGDFNTSTQFEPSHTYQNSGSYTVSLIARNECYCNDTTQMIVNVLDAAVPEIDCIGTVCEGETVTYSTDVNCGTYNWNVIGGGTILDGGGITDNFITIEWTSGSEGFIDLTVSGCAGNICVQPNIVPIPIISDDAQIEGEQRVCSGSIEEYFIPDFGGTDIFWSVSNGGFIIDGFGTNKISVNWFGSPTGSDQFVAVEFDNCYLGCGGRDTLDVKIVPEFYVQGPIEICEGETTQFFGINAFTGAPVACDWTISDGLGTTIVTIPNDPNPFVTMNHAPGRYAMTATPVNTSAYCTGDYRVFFEIIEPPLAPNSIAGTILVCPNEIYTYEAIGDPENSFAWVINNGGTVSTQTGNPVNVLWGSAPPYTLSVTQTSTSGLPCESDAFSMNIDPVPQVTITGDSEVCIEETTIHSTTFFPDIDYVWEILPDNSGTIISGQNSENIEVLWHSPGNGTVRLNLCDQVVNTNVIVRGKPGPNVIHPNGLCSGETALIQTVDTHNSYIWKNASGVIVSTAPDPMLLPGYYELEVTNSFGCVGETTFQVETYSVPTASISVPIYLGFCIGGPTATIQATTSGGGFTYQWFLNGSPVGSNTPTFTTNIPGTYQIVVTDQNGCVGNSNQLELLECISAGGICVGGICTNPACDNPGGGCTPAGNISFDINTTSECLTHDYVNTSTNFIPGSLIWDFGDPASGVDNTSTLENPSHTFTQPGYYSVLLIGQVPDANNPGATCLDGQLSQDVIYAVAEFEFEKACPGSPTEFTDISNYLEFTSIASWEWDFGDPASGAANASSDQNPTHVYNSVGNYNVTLTVVSSEGCQSSITKAVDVFNPPVVSFNLPTESCEGLALNFLANVSGDVTSLSWDFGEPASGDANSSELQDAYHAYENPGVYTISLTAENIYGCSEVFAQNLTIEPNNLNGDIQYSQPSPICEGDQITLTAPSGGISWNWSDGSSNQTVIADESSVWKVTITDDEGCTFTPDPAIVEVFEAPNGDIRAVEYNEFGQPIGIFDDNYSVCEGEDVTLVILGSLNYSYIWSNGEPGDEISFTEIKDNTLPQGDHDFSVTITDNTNGCTAVEGPFTVTVHPVPEDIQIISTPSGPLCENNQAVLSVNNPEPGLTYIWNTGEIGTSISVVAGGTYFVRGVNQFGCEGESNHLTIQNAPDITKIPSGCHSRCTPDTLCLPFIPGVANYQWYFNGSPIPGPNGTVPNLIADQSGEYFVEMTDWWGCTSISGTLTLDLYDGFGTILGNVYFDVNGNGIIDAPDTLVNEVNIFINDGTNNLDTVSSNGAGNYAFANILSTDYTLYLDTLNLPAGWSAISSEENTTLIGCDVEEEVNWLLTFDCTSPPTNLELSLCESDSISYQGVFLHPGDIESFTLSNADNCDSVVNVTVLELSTDFLPLTLETCENATINYEGTDLSPGEMMDFTFVNQNGCDSVVQVTVEGLPLSAEVLSLNACENGSTIYDGQTLFPGDVQEFTFQNQNGCDSVVTVTVIGVPPDQTPLLLNACENGSVIYSGTTLVPGDMQDFTFQNQIGCDSIVTVTVQAILSDTSQMQMEICEGTSTFFQGIELFVGDAQDFIFQNQIGCDSVVEVSVSGIPLGHSDLTLTACQNASVDYKGETLFPGDVQTFTLQSSQTGCDSTVTVTVDAAPLSDTSIVIQVCEGLMANYNGQDLGIGTQTPFQFQNVYGCDSTVLVNVDAFPSSSFDLISNTICINSTDGQIEVTNIQGVSNPYVYSIDGINFQNSPTFNGLMPENYTVTIEDVNGCQYDETISIPIIPELKIQVEDQFIPCDEGEIRITPLVISGDLNTLSWLWPDGSTEQSFVARDAGVYTVEVSDQCETITHDIEVLWGIDNRESFIYMPNAFSPNEDSVNDKYRGYLSSGIELVSYELMIFDRWGNMLFSTENIEEGWDGILNNRDMNAAVYVYWMTANVLSCGRVIEVFKKGDIVLVR